MIRLDGTAGLGPALDAWRDAGRRIAFVPTMGALHGGHLSLVRLARRHGDRVVASIFVNPAQFDEGADLERYPRTPDRDAELLEAAGCDLVFFPTPDDIYPPGFSTWVEPKGPAEGLEGAHRGGHFRGVATVVLALFGLVRPDAAVFGQKDAQQLAVIERMVRDFSLPLTIVPGPTVREEDGLALSSRNVFLSPAERRTARALFQALEVARRAIEAGERDADAVRRLLRRVLEEAPEPGLAVDYAEVVDAGSFQPVEVLAGTVVLPLAARVGATRLIDNLRLDVDALDALDDTEAHGDHPPGDDDERESPSSASGSGESAPGAAPDAFTDPAFDRTLSPPSSAAPVAVTARRVSISPTDRLGGPVE